MGSKERQYIKEELYRPLIERLQRRRSVRNLTLEYVSNRIRVAGQTVYHWETGEKIPSFMRLVMWAEALDYKLTVVDIISHGDLDGNGHRKPLSKVD